MSPLLLALPVGALALLALSRSRKGEASAPAPPAASLSLMEKIARALVQRDPTELRRAAARLREEGKATSADLLILEAERIEAGG